MSDIAIGGSSAAPSPFSLRTVAVMLAVGILGFIGTVVLGAYAPDLRGGENGGAHALSNAATGYSALVALAQATDRHARITRTPDAFSTEDLLVVTPEKGATDISAVLQSRLARPTLFVLPKWDTVADPKHPGWVRSNRMLPAAEPLGVLAPGIRFGMVRYRSSGELLQGEGLPSGIRFHAPRMVQAITGMRATPREDGSTPALYPLITDSAGHILLAQVGEGPLYVLADPDLLSNQGLKDVEAARSALLLLDWLNSNDPEGIAFDVSLNGLGVTRSPLKLLLEPPFLALTLTIVAALILAGWHATARFGPLARRERAIALGKAALVDNGAMLVRKARREAAMGTRYAAMARERAARIFGAPARLRDAALDAYLDALGGPAAFTDLARNAEQARDRATLLDAARALHQWHIEKLGKSK
ncbi:hypothetical protein ABIC65_003427 [Sphingomonas trueperi]|uniref:DUF4350 domain-containing protein n=1 Tax=Sphingomonas trueperi TaxID=53317 RepID=UPI0033928D4C